MSGVAIGRLTEERKNWRKRRPVGFYARPIKKDDNSTDIMTWETGIPGKANTIWEGGVYKVLMEFTDEYPMKPPKCKFVPPLFHPNVFSSGKICLNILNEDEGWRPAITIEHMLLGIQDLLDNPNDQDPAHFDALKLYQQDIEGYKTRIREQAAKNLPES